MTLSDLPPLNATLNGISALLLVAGWRFIRTGRRIAHRNCMIAALITSTIFLGCYLTYHFQMQRLYGRAHTSFVDPAWFRPIYLTLLAAFVVLSWFRDTRAGVLFFGGNCFGMSCSPLGVRVCSLTEMLVCGICTRGKHVHDRLKLMLGGFLIV